MDLKELLQPNKKKILFFILATFFIIFLPIIPCTQYCYTGPDSVEKTDKHLCNTLDCVLEPIFPVCGTCFIEYDQLTFFVILLSTESIAYFLVSLGIFFIRGQRGKKNGW